MRDRGHGDTRDSTFFKKKRERRDTYTYGRYQRYVTPPHLRLRNGSYLRCKPNSPRSPLATASFFLLGYTPATAQAGKGGQAARRRRSQACSGRESIGLSNQWRAYLRVIDPGGVWLSPARVVVRAHRDFLTRLSAFPQVRGLVYPPKPVNPGVTPRSGTVVSSAPDRTPDSYPTKPLNGTPLENP